MKKKTKAKKKDKNMSELEKLFTLSDQSKQYPQPRLDGVRLSSRGLIGPSSDPNFDYSQIIGPSPSRREK